MSLETIIIDLYRKTATEIPQDVLDALECASRKESGTGKGVMDAIIRNCKLAKNGPAPICQDTGTPIFYVRYGKGRSQRSIRDAIIGATRKATKSIPLRPNAVEPVSGLNSDDNTGISFPNIHMEEDETLDGMEITLMLKGGGSENVGKQYSLPDRELGAGRDLEGVRKCILDAIYRAQGKGCPPGIVSVCIGGSKDTVSFVSKRRLTEKLGKTNPNPELGRLEKRVLDEANLLGIGPMGLGGKTAVLDVKICAVHRHPASYFVDVAYSCWALRRNTVRISSEGEASYV
ncbi:MAG: fumarate hydratase [Candidatus Bilamarchaeaceae archaeon]